MLKITISWDKAGEEDVATYEGEPRLAEIIVQEFGFQDAKSILIPIAKVNLDEDSEKFGPL